MCIKRINACNLFFKRLIAYIRFFLRDALIVIGSNCVNEDRTKNEFIAIKI